MTDVVPFGWPTAATSTLPVTAISSRIQYDAVTPGVKSRRVRVVNYGASNVYIDFGGSAVSATVPTASSTSGSLLMLPNTVEVFTSAGTFIAAITSTSTSSLAITPGEGI